MKIELEKEIIEKILEILAEIPCGKTYGNQFASFIFLNFLAAYNIALQEKTDEPTNIVSIVGSDSPDS